MNIIDVGLSFKSLSYLGIVERIILHHAEWENCTIYDIHNAHKNNGWSGVGYHFFVRKDGRIYRGRPEGKLGAHTSNNNFGSLGICFEGDLNKRKLTTEQIVSGQELVTYLCDKYKLSKSKVYRHKDFNSTDCPGNMFDIDKIKNVSRETLENGGIESMILFSENWYLYRYTDVSNAVKNGTFKSGYEHYTTYGKYETPKRVPLPPVPSNYNERDYLELNQDINEAVKNGTFTSGIHHYLEHGFKENRKCCK